MKNSDIRLELKRKKMMKDMKKQIHKLEYQIQTPKKENIRRTTIKSLKISLKIAQFTAPYILCAALTFAGAHAIGLTPFYRNDKNTYLQTKKEFDNFGNIRLEEHYKEYEDEENTLSYYGEWKKSNDEFYSRNVEVYSLNELSEDEINKLLKDSNISSLEEVLGNPISTKTEQANNLTTEDFYSNGYLVATVYDRNKNNYIVEKESIEDDIGFSFLYIAAILLESYFIYMGQKFPSLSSINSQINAIKENYEPIDVIEAKMKLKIKKENYDRLMR